MVFFEALTDEDGRCTLERVYAKTNGILFAYAMDILKDKGLAEDAVQESFIRLSKNLDKIDSPDSSRTVNYMVTIVKNLCYTMYRRRSRGNVCQLQDFDGDENDSSLTVEEVVIEREEYMWLKEAIASLSESLREPLILHFYGGMKDSEIAELIGISPVNVGVRIFRAKKKIKEYIGSKEADTNDREG